MMANRHHLADPATPSGLDGLDDARRTRSKAVSQNTVPPARYGLPAPEAT